MSRTNMLVYTIFQSEEYDEIDRHLKQFPTVSSSCMCHAACVVWCNADKLWPDVNIIWLGDELRMLNSMTEQMYDFILR